MVTPTVAFHIPFVPSPFVIWGPFLENPENFSGLKAICEIANRLV